MAIKTDILNSQYGVGFNSAYFRVVTASVSRGPNEDCLHTVMIDVAGYAVKPKDADTLGIDFRRYHCPLEEVEAKKGSGFIAQCYEWVMAQEDMLGSTAA